MDSVLKILHKLGIDSPSDMEVGNHHTISNAGFMDLTLEKVSTDHLSVAHYHTQRGDLMRDPEVVFDISDARWLPVEFRQDPNMHQHSALGIDVTDFLKQWDTNLKNQGFVEAAADQ